MMKKFVFALAVLLMPVLAHAQASTAVAGRASVGVDYKIAKGFHINVSEELRSGDGFSSIGSLRTTVGLSYKPIKYLKLGVGYVNINPYKVNKEITVDDNTTTYTGFWNPRHRFYFDATGHVNVGDFQFGLKERLQLTHRTGDFNVYQETPNALALKSRVYAKYRRWKAFEPSVYFELRTALNAPWGNRSAELVDGEDYYQYTPAGYTHVYNNRYRGCIKADWNIGKHHTLAPFVLLDYCSDYEIDTNKKGTKFYGAQYVDVFRVSLGLGYTFNF